MNRKLKKIASILSICTMFNMFTFTANDYCLAKSTNVCKNKNMEQIQKKVISSNNIELEQARKIAINFINDNVKTNINCKWNCNTSIKESISLYDEKDNIDAYLFILKNNLNSNGYIVISANTNTDLVLEFSYRSQPNFKNQNNLEKVYYTGLNRYYMKIGNELTDVNGNIITRDNLNTDFMYDENMEYKNKKYIEEINFNISNKFTSLRRNIGAGTFAEPGGKKVSEKILPFSKSNQDYMETGKNKLSNCALTSIHEIFTYYWVVKHYTNFPMYYPGDDIQNYIDPLYEYEKKRAISAYGYSDEGGLGFTKIPDLINDCIHHYGYSGNATNRYLYTASSIKDEIDSSRPLIMNIGSGKYKDHTVSIYGYAEYYYSGDSTTYATISDHWQEPGVDDSTIYLSIGGILHISNITTIHIQ